MKYFIILLIFLSSCYLTGYENMQSKYEEFIKSIRNVHSEKNDIILKEKIEKEGVHFIYLCNKKLVKFSNYTQLNKKADEIFKGCVRQSKCMFIEQWTGKRDEKVKGEIFIEFVIMNKKIEIADYYFYPPVTCRVKCLSGVINMIEKDINENGYSKKCSYFVVRLYFDRGESGRLNIDGVNNIEIPEGIMFGPEINDNK